MAVIKKLSKKATTSTPKKKTITKKTTKQVKSPKKVPVKRNAVKQTSY